MIIVLFQECAPLDLVERSFRAFAQFFARIPVDEKNAERFDRRVFRWVLCGEHGFVRAAREQCPQCGGYAEPFRNHALAKRLKQSKAQTVKAMKQAAASVVRSSTSRRTPESTPRRS